MSQQYWLMKTEPDVFSLDDLARVKRAPWEGVRNFQARNFMRDKMRRGDLILIYHSSCPVPGVAGIAEVCREAYPDSSSWDIKSPYYDPRSTPQKPVWMMVEIEFVQKFRSYVSLAQMRGHEQLKGMLVLKKGMRLSIQPVQENHFQFLQKLGGSLDRSIFTGSF